MPQRGIGDPLLKGRDWQRARTHWIRRREPCRVCGVQINYTPGYNGPDAFDCGHIVSRHEARTLGWTRAQVNSISNTRPECRRCNRAHGALLATRKAQHEPITSGVWD